MTTGANAGHFMEVLAMLLWLLGVAGVNWALSSER